MSPAAKSALEERCNPRSASRLAAVQALYEIEFGFGEPEVVISEFIDRRLGAEVDGDRYADADPDFFRDLVRGGEGRSAEVDELMNEALGPERTPQRLNGVLRALLRAATFELLGRKDVPARVVLDEYLDVAHAFFSGPETKLVNGVLDALAHRLRPDEF